MDKIGKEFIVMDVRRGGWWWWGRDGSDFMVMMFTSTSGLHPDACIVSCVFFSIGFLPYGTSDKRTESLDDYLAGECTIHKISSYIRYLPVYLDTHVGTGTD